MEEMEEMEEIEEKENKRKIWPLEVKQGPTRHRPMATPQCLYSFITLSGEIFMLIYSKISWF